MIGRTEKLTANQNPKFKGHSITFNVTLTKPNALNNQHDERYVTETRHCKKTSLSDETEADAIKKDIWEALGDYNRTNKNVTTGAFTPGTFFFF